MFRRITSGAEEFASAGRSALGPQGPPAGGRRSGRLAASAALLCPRFSSGTRLRCRMPKPLVTSASQRLFQSFYWLIKLLYDPEGMPAIEQTHTGQTVRAAAGRAQTRVPRGGPPCVCAGAGLPGEYRGKKRLCRKRPAEEPASRLRLPCVQAS